MPTSPTGVVHLGLGAFHRAHQAMVFDQLRRSGDTRWAITGVGMRRPELVQCLRNQHHRYSVQVTGASGPRWHTVSAIQATLMANTERAQVVQAIAHPQCRWVTLTVSEKAYTHALASLLVQALATRHRQGGLGLTIASCDNLSGNGHLLRQLCLAQAEIEHPALIDWIDRHVRFPNSMVDRIVPQVSTEGVAQAAQALGWLDRTALVTESFWEWVIEDNFADPSDAEVLRLFGVQVEADVQVFEEAKLRMLNASHSALAAAGAVLGLATMHEVVALPALRQWAHLMMTHDIAPHLRRIHLHAYRDALLERFANPGLRHLNLQICNDNSQKIPLRWVPSVLAARQRQKGAVHLAFAAAVWMRFLHGSDEQGRSYEWSDPLRAPLQVTALAHAHDPVSCAQQLLGHLPIWDQALASDAIWCKGVAQSLAQIQALGLIQALNQHLQRHPV